MRSAVAGLCALLLLASIVPAHAGERAGIGIKAGTLGFGVDLTGRVTDWFGVRGTFNTADVSHSEEISDIDYDGDIALGAYGLVLDFHPFRNDFRVTAGFLRNRTGVDLTGRPTEDVTIGDTTYTPAQVGTLDGDVTFERNVPYLGIGYGSAAKGPHRVRFLFDLGVFDQGSGEVSLASSTGLVQPSDLEEEIDEIEEDIEDYDLWPVVSFGISFRL